AGEHLAVVDERADLVGPRARIDQPRDPLARGQLGLLVDALDIRRAPAGLDLAPAIAQPLLERAERFALLGGGAVVDELVQRVADRNQWYQRHRPDASRTRRRAPRLC